MLSKSITLVESALEKHQELAHEIIDACLPHSGNSLRIGITGVPGVGKSTFIETFGTHLLSQGKRVAVLAVDPSSEQSKGSILGDKTRMNELARDPHAFVRPSPAAGSLGGVARKTRESIILCEAAGYDTIIIETVGVGQSETAVHSMVDFFLLLMLAGAGDELQGIKRGIIEMADALVINKADGKNEAAAQAAKAAYRRALHLFPPRPDGWIPQVTSCSAQFGKGIDTVQELIENHAQQLKDNGFFETNRKKQAKYWMHETIQESLYQHFYNDPEVASQLKILEEQVINARISPFKAAQALINHHRIKQK